MAAIPASHHDLLGTDVAVLSTIGPDGRPQSSAVWFLADGDTIQTSLNTSRQKTKNLQRNPACTLLILDLANPYRYLEGRGDAALEADPDYEFADKLGAKYGADLREHDGPGDSRVKVTFRPVRVHAVNMRGWRRPLVRRPRPPSGHVTPAVSARAVR